MKHLHPIVINCILASVLALRSEIDDKFRLEHPAGVDVVESAAVDDQTEGWRWMSDINGEARNDRSGMTVAMSSDGAIVAFGSPFNDDNDNNSGQVRVYSLENEDQSWNQLGNDIYGEAVRDEFGTSVALSADGLTLAVGAVKNNGNGVDSGHVRVYKFSAEINEWIQFGDDINGSTNYDNFGFSVALSAEGTRLVAGSACIPSQAVGCVSYVQLFVHQGFGWFPNNAKIQGEYSSSRAGLTVSLSADGMTLAVGSCQDDGNGENSGTLRVYQTPEYCCWQQVGPKINGSGNRDRLGYYIALSGDGSTVAVGSDHNANNGNRPGRVQVFHVNENLDQLGADLKGSEGDNFGKGVALSYDGLLLATGGLFVHVYKLDEELLEWNVFCGHTCEYMFDNKGGESVALSADGTMLATGDPFFYGPNGRNSGQVRIYNYIYPPTASPVASTPAPTASTSAPTGSTSAPTASTSAPTASPNLCTSVLKMVLWTDYNGSQTSYDLADISNDSVVFESRDLQADLYYGESACLTAGNEYRFTIFDTDGICCNNGAGFYMLSTNGKQLHYGAEFENSRSVVFTAKPLDSSFTEKYSVGQLSA